MEFAKTKLQVPAAPKSPPLPREAANEKDGIKFNIIPGSLQKEKQKDNSLRFQKSMAIGFSHLWSLWLQPLMR